MEVTKRTYQKHKTEKKITVKHYLNLAIKEFNDYGNEIYPVYVQVTFNRKSTKFRSQVLPSPRNTISSVIDINNFKNSEERNQLIDEKFFEQALTKDEELIKWIINYQVTNKPDTFEINDLPKIYHKQFYQLGFFVDWSLKQEIQKTVLELDDIEYDLSEIDDVIKYPMFFNASSLENFEFMLSHYPELIKLKEKYASNIWFFSIYIGLISNHKNKLYSKDMIEDEMFYIEPYSLPPTIYDFIQDGFKERFLKTFLNSQTINKMLVDLDVLFLKYYEVFMQVFLDV